MTSAELRRGLFARRRGRAAALLLSLVALVGVFADLLASDGPVLLARGGRWYVLPAVTTGGLTDAPWAPTAGDLAVFPLVRAGAATITPAPPMSGASRAHPLGIDAFGRDVFARLVHGTRATLLLGSLAALIALGAGGLLGAAAGALGGFWDSATLRFIEVTGVFPTVVAVALVQALERRLSAAALVLVAGAVNGASIARTTRVMVMKAANERWAIAPRRTVTGHPRLTLGRLAPGHLARRLAPSLAISLATTVGSVALTETSLVFLELGSPPGAASWGRMLGEVRWGAAPHTLLPPLLSLGLTTGALYLLADALREALES